MVKEIEDKGGKAFKGNVNDDKSVKGVTEGIHTVISALNSMTEKTLFEGQRNVFNDGLKNKIKRFFPSEYALNYSQEQIDENPYIKWKDDFQKLIDLSDVQSVRVNQGIFMDFLFNFYPNGLGYWGDANQKIQLTTFNDTAKFIVELAAHPEKHGNFTFIGQELTIPEIAEIYNKERGTNIQPTNFGTIEDLDKTMLKKKEDNDNVGHILTQLTKNIHSGKCLFHKNDNSMFPHIQPITFEQMLKENPDLKFK